MLCLSNCSKVTIVSCNQYRHYESTLSFLTRQVFLTTFHTRVHSNTMAKTFSICTNVTIQHKAFPLKRGKEGKVRTFQTNYLENFRSSTHIVYYNVLHLAAVYYLSFFGRMQFPINQIHHLTSNIYLDK